MAGYGTGYPLWFECPKARRYYRSDPAEQARLRDNHSVTLTGKTKPVPFDGKSHPRRSQLSREYVCECGHQGWSSHIDLERYGRTT